MDEARNEAMSDSHCNVSLGGYDGDDEAAFYNEKRRRARKPYVCHECHEVIEKGQIHQVATGKWDGEIRSYRFCDPCWNVMGEFSENNWRTFGATWETFRNEWSAGATLQGCLNRLSSTEEKEHMHRQWLKWKRLG